MTRATIFFALLLGVFCAHAAKKIPAPTLAYTIVAEHPHDAELFTQGLLLHDGVLYESSGGYGRSQLLARRRSDGKILAERNLPPEIFGEGLARIGRRLVLLSWREQRGFVFDLKLDPLQEFRYAGEGWGLAYDGKRLLMSDGSAWIRRLDARTFAERSRVQVTDAGVPVERLNELEVVGGLLYANLWQQERVAVIAPDSGAVRGWLDFSTLRLRFSTPPDWNPANDVLNGIACDPQTGHLLVTGKHWPKLFEIAAERPR